MKKYIIMILILGVSNLYAQVQDTFDMKIQKMLELNGSKENFKLVINSMLDIQEKEYPQISTQEFFTTFREEVLKDGYDAIVAKLIPVYKETFSEDEIDGVIDFLESDIGKSLTEKNPIIMEKSMKIGEEWGGELAEEIHNRITNSNELKMNKEFVKDCKDFKEGVFENMIINKDEEIKIRIERYGNIQIEKVEGQKDIKQKIEWISECKYALIEIMEDGTLLENERLEVNILERNENSYKYLARLINLDFFMEGELVKIESKD